MPSWARNSRSHSSTAEISTPAAWACQFIAGARLSVIRPQTTICTVGQYISSTSRGIEPRRM